MALGALTTRASVSTPGNQRAYGWRVLEEQAGQARSGSLHGGVTRREDLKQLDQVDTGLVPDIAGCQLDHAQQPVEGLLLATGGDLQVGRLDLRVEIVGLLRRRAEDGRGVV